MKKSKLPKYVVLHNECGEDAAVYQRLSKSKVIDKITTSEIDGVNLYCCRPVGSSEPRPIVAEKLMCWLTDVRDAVDSAIKAVAPNRHTMRGVIVDLSNDKGKRGKKDE